MSRRSRFSVAAGDLPGSTAPLRGPWPSGAKTAILFDLLDAAYLRPAGSQTAAAARLGTSARSFRRHRKRAVTLLAVWLWERECTLASPRSLNRMVASHDPCTGLPKGGGPTTQEGE
ncbi:MAG: hypothetical protein L0H19_00830 [Salinisphaera sp.]|nr:hypothetical protein [Salinisphaera sp.]